MRAYAKMQPRLEAEEKLGQLTLGLIQSPHADQNWVKATIEHWSALAQGRDPNPTLDAEGRTIIRTGAELRRWFEVEGEFRSGEVG